MSTTRSLLSFPPLDPDPDSNGKPSDHFIPVMKPINAIDNKRARTTRLITVLPILESGMDKLKSWMSLQKWETILEEKSIDKKAESLQLLILSKVNQYLPEKKRSIASDDDPWMTQDVKDWNRKRHREYHKNKRSQKYHEINNKYQKKLKAAKKKFKRRMIDNIKDSNKSQWYSKLKWISNYDQHKVEPIIVEEINHLTDSQQAEAIADHLSAISNEYDHLKTEDIKFSPIPPGSFPQFSTEEIQKYLENIKTKKSTVLGDVPARVLKECAQYLCIPVRDVISQSILTGKWAKIYKKETITPIPKSFPPESVDQLRPIANLLNINKIQEAAIAELVVSDMEKQLDPSQYGNRRSTSIQHYLVKLLHKILEAVDKSSNKEINAVLCLFVDWRQAYSRQCHLLGIKSFQENGVRPSLIPLLANYFQDRELRVKWRSHYSEPRCLPGGGAMGATLGNLEFTSQTNHNADCVPQDKRFKWVDDLTTLEKINLLNIGMSSYNFRNHIASDIPTHGQYINNEDLRSQQYLTEINNWTNNQKMEINQNKTKAMVVNFTNTHQFTSRLQLKGQNIEIVDNMKILGLTVSNKLDWNMNTSILVKKINARMVLLRSVFSFGASISEMVHLWKLFCLSVLEQSCAVWGSSITNENAEDLERTQKSFAKLVLGEKYVNYESALIRLNLEDLASRRRNVMIKFAKTGIKNKKLHELFPLRKIAHKMIKKSRYLPHNHS